MDKHANKESVPGSLNLVDTHGDKIDIAYLQELFPKKKNTITQETVELITATMEDPMFNGYNLIDTMMDYEKVMYDGRSGINDYINAIKFCSYLEGDATTIIDAYKYTFSRVPFVRERMDMSSGTPGYNELSNAASRYRKRPVVQTILTRSNMSLYLMFQGHTYRAVEVLAKEMKDAPYSKDRISAADKLLTHVKAPEGMTIDLNIDHGDEVKGFQEKMFAQLAVAAVQQKALLDAGMPLEEAQKLHIKEDVIDAEVEE